MNQNNEGAQYNRQPQQEQVQNTQAQQEQVQNAQPQQAPAHEQTYQQQYQQTYQQTFNPQTDEPVKQNKTFATIALVLGILSFFCNPMYLFSLGAVVLGIIALVIKNGSGKGMAIAGIICGGISLVFWLIMDTVLAIFTGGLSFFL